MVRNVAVGFPGDDLLHRRIDTVTSPGHNVYFDADQLANTLFGTHLAATFLVPPLLALALGKLLPLDGAATAGLFLIAVAPGAPLMTRGVAKKGFDMQIAASYQVWGALLTPLMIPLLVDLPEIRASNTISRPLGFSVLRIIVMADFAGLQNGSALAIGGDKPFGLMTTWKGLLTFPLPEASLTRPVCWSARPVKSCLQ